VAIGNETYKLNLKNQNYKYDNYTKKESGRQIAIACDLGASCNSLLGRLDVPFYNVNFES
jgi:hypothetical protein